MVFLVVLLFVFLIAALICAVKESSVTSVYKSNNVYGRFSAYIALDLSLFGLFAIIGFLIPILRRNMFGNSPTIIIIGIICLAIGALLYLRALKKCPTALKSKCVGSMIVTGLGVSMKIAVFFVPAVWKLTGSQSTYAVGFASSYISRVGNDRYYLHSVNGNYAILRAPDGGLVNVVPHGNEGNVADSANNLYYPER